MHIDGQWFKDEHGRTLILRGANLGGSTKVPYKPNGATYIREGFFDHRNVSFVGRPFPLDEADEHLSRLRAWGMTFLRFLITWEAVEHAGPGEYDQEYLDYLYTVVKKAGDYGIHVFIDPHQDVWSRWTGGDGAPGWTLEAVGMDLTRLSETGAAIVHAVHGDPFPRMIWPTNYTKLGAATMFTLFFGGDDFAPHTQINGVPVQEYLQSHYVNAVQQVALRLKDLPNVVGYDSLNEPGGGFIGIEDLTAVPGGLLRAGASPTPFQAMLLGSGYPQQVEVQEMGLTGSQQLEPVTLNPGGISLWKDGYECVWKQNGVWTDEGGQPHLLRPDHFAQVGGRKVDFANDYLKPFIKRFIAAIRAVDPRAILFLEGIPFGGHPHWGPDDPPNAVNAAHWYDGLTLITKHFNPDMTFDLTTGQVVTGMDAIRQAFVNQLAATKRVASEHMGGIPTLLGEFGIPFDLDDRAAYKTGDFSTHVQALDAYYNAMDANLLNCTIWNYTADNTNARGDLWNDEDLSIFSRDQQTDPQNIHSGGRGLAAIARPYARKVAGEPLRMHFDLPTRTFELEFRHDPAVTAPTEIFVPDYQYPKGYVVELSDGAYQIDRQALTLTVHHTPKRETHTVRIRPAKLDNC
jgi:hypothetical protein